MARSTVAQRVQIGRETQRGTTVPASRSLGSLSLALSPEVESEAHRTRGVKYPTIVANNKEWSTGDLEGTPTYDEVVIPLASVFTQATVAAVMDGAEESGAYRWQFDPASTGADQPVTYTLEQGDSDVAERASHVLFTDFSMEFSREEVTQGGTVVARRLERDGVTLTPAATPLAANMVPILPGQVSMFVADTPDGLDDEANRIKTALSIAPEVGGRFEPVWYLNALEPSFSTFVETPEPDFTADLTVEANRDGMAWAGLFRTGQTKFLRIHAEGPVIAGEVRYLFQWDLAVKVLEPGEQSDEDGLYAIAPSLQIVHDPTWGRATQVTVVNTVASI